LDGIIFARRETKPAASDKPACEPIKEAKMCKRLLMILLGLLLILPGMTASGIPENGGKTIRTGVRPGKAYLMDSGMASISAAKGDKARVVLMAASSWAYYSSEDAEYMQHIIDGDQADLITIYVDFSAVLNTRVRFHVYWAGPEFYAYDEEGWLPARYKTSDYTEENIYYISIDPQEWKTGTYKIVIIAEQETLGSGAESVIECIYRLI
jgi:hypothetical protein